MITFEQIHQILRIEFGDAVVEVVAESAHPQVVIEARHWPEVAQFLRDDRRIQLNFLRSISAQDLLAENLLSAVYDFHSMRPGDSADGLWKCWAEFAVCIKVDRDNPVISSVAHLWPAADWHEREAYDLMGIVFSGHPDLRRILCPDDWVGHPLRKDYVFPLEYHGIPATTEYDLPNPVH